MKKEIKKKEKISEKEKKEWEKNGNRMKSFLKKNEKNMENECPWHILSPPMEYSIVKSNSLLD